MSDEEEMVAVDLGEDYYLGAYFTTDHPRDYLIPRSQLERWEAAQAAYEDMQSEIEQVMNAQRERARALRTERWGTKSPMARFLEGVYEQPVIDALQAPATFRRMTDGRPE